MRIRLVPAAALVSLLSLAPMALADQAAPSAGPVQADALALAHAMDVPDSDLVAADLMGSDPRAAAVSGQLGASFPTRGQSFAILSTGVAADAALPDAEDDHSSVLDGLNNVQGNDLTRLHLQLRAPAQADCANLDAGFYSEESLDGDADRFLRSPNPEIGATLFNDTFTAQLDDSTLAINPNPDPLAINPAGWTVDAPGNLALFQGFPVAAYNMAFDPPDGLTHLTGTTYDVATPRMRVSTPVAGGHMIDLYLSIQDLGDSAYDSAAFLDDFFWSSGTDCQSGAQADSDGDGLPDSWEEFGLTVDGQFLDLPAMGADPRHKNVFVETDYMVGTFNHQPMPQAMATVEKAFAEAPVANPDGTSGVNLHVDYGPDAPVEYGSTTTFGTMSRAGAVPEQLSLGTSTGATPSGPGDYDWSAFDQIKAQSFDPVRLAVFHYVVFGHKLGGDYSFVGGLSRALPASDLVILMGGFTNQVGTLAEQAGTFMHELGHNLGLHHGGADEVNAKPNYLSVMNYLFSTGIPVGRTAVKFDYSRSQLAPLDESDLSEPDGIGPSDVTGHFCPNGNPSLDLSGPSIDWNCDGDKTDTGVAADINADGVKSTLVGYDDWAHLVFTGGSIGAAGGHIPLPDATPVNEITPEQAVKVRSLTDVTPPTLSVPANLLVNATKPGGATVGFGAGATDDVDPSPAVTCSPASGSTFPIGATSVSCSATDLAGNRSQAGFTVKVKGAPEQIVDLVNKLRADLKLKALADPLAAYLQTVSNTVIQRKPQLACIALKAFVAGVKLVPRKSLADAQKAELLADATRIGAVIGC